MTSRLHKEHDGDGALAALFEAAVESGRPQADLMHIILTSALPLATADIALVCGPDSSLLYHAALEGVPNEAVHQLARHATHVPIELVDDTQYVARLSATGAYFLALRWLHGRPALIDSARAVRGAVARVLLGDAEHPVRDTAIDPLTKLPSRTASEQHLDNLLAAVERRGARVGVLLVDVDGFKMINDTFGHDVGDQTLIAMATRIKETARGNDFVGRLRDDKFIVAITVVGDALELAEAAQDFLERALVEVSEGGFTTLVRSSIGIAVSPEDGTTALQLLAHADEALFTAKEKGGNIASWYRDPVEAPVIPSPGESYRALLTGTDEPVAIRQKVTGSDLTGAALRDLRQRLGLTIPEVARVLGAGERTIIRKEQQRSPLSVTEGDRAYRLAHVADLATDLIGDAEKARSWLRASNTYLGSETPVSMLETEIGTELVVQSLYAIAYGGVG